MATKTYTLVILFLIGMVTTFSTCKKRYGCDNIIYKFQLGVKVYPDTEVIQIGDTLWFEINTPIHFRDITTNQIINYSSAVNLGSAIGFVKFENNDSITLAANLFDNILKVGFQVNNFNKKQIREYLFDEKNGDYMLKLGIVPKETGVYGIGFSKANNVYRKSDYCTKALFNINIEATKRHFYLNPFLNSSNIDTTKPSGSYYFKVN